MPSGSGGLVGGACVILLGVAAFLIDYLGAASWWLAGSLAATQIMAVIWLFTGTWAIRCRVALVVGVLAGAAVMSLPGPPSRSVGLAVAGCCHAAAYLSLLIWFATSLRPGREAAVTRFARRVRRTMPDKVVRHTRRVTIAWCVFFAAQLAASAGLLLMAPAAAWSVFVNLLNLPLLATMVLAEFGARLILFRHEPRTSLIDTLSAMRHARGIPANRT